MTRKEEEMYICDQIYFTHIDFVCQTFGTAERPNNWMLEHPSSAPTKDIS